MKVGAKSTSCPIADDRFDRTGSSLELTFQRARHRKLSQSGGVLSIRRRPSCLMLSDNASSDSHLPAQGSRKHLAIESHCGYLSYLPYCFFWTGFCLPSPCSASGARQNFTACENPLICSQLLTCMRAQCASVAHWPGRANMQALHTGLGVAGHRGD